MTDTADAGRIARYIPPVIVMVVATLFLVLTYRLPVAARAMPAVVGWTTLGLGAIDLVSRFRGQIGTALMRALNPSGLIVDAEDRPGTTTVATSIGLVVCLITSFLLLGVLPAAAITIFGSLMIGYPREWWRNAIIAAVATLGIWLLFALVLRLQLYGGLMLGGTS